MTKKRDLERELERAGWKRIEPGANHDKFRKGTTVIPVPRHREIPDRMANAILREAGLR